MAFQSQHAGNQLFHPSSWLLPCSSPLSQVGLACDQGPQAHYLTPATTTAFMNNVLECLFTNHNLKWSGRHCLWCFVHGLPVNIRWCRGSRPSRSFKGQCRGTSQDALDTWCLDGIGRTKLPFVQSDIRMSSEFDSLFSDEWQKFSAPRTHRSKGNSAFYKNKSVTLDHIRWSCLQVSDLMGIPWDNPHCMCTCGEVWGLR